MVEWLGRWCEGSGIPFSGHPSIFEIEFSSLYTGRQAVLATRCTVATNCDRIRSVVDTCGLLLRLQTGRSMTNGRSETQLKTREGA